MTLRRCSCSRFVCRCAAAARAVRLDIDRARDRRFAITIAANVALYRHDVHFDVSREGRNTPPAQFTAVIDNLPLRFR